MNIEADIAAQKQARREGYNPHSDIHAYLARCQAIKMQLLSQPTEQEDKFEEARRTR